MLMLLLKEHWVVSRPCHPMVVSLDSCSDGTGPCFVLCVEATMMPRCPALFASQKWL